MLPNLRDVYLARQRIAPVALRTPLVASAALSQHLGADVRLKLETVQPTGSFKVRGAANRLLSLPSEQRDRGVVAFSTGNHGLAVAFVAAEVAAHAVVCVSERVAHGRQARLEEQGAEVVVHGASQAEAGERASELQRERGLTMMPPFDDPLIIAGQGTIGLELLEDWPAIDTVLVPVSGGGLASGIAVALKAADPTMRVVGVSMERAPVMHHSLQVGHPVELPEADTLADSLQGGIGLDNQFTFELVRTLIDQVILVAEAEIGQAMAFLLHRERLVVEGAGAVGVAALLAGKATNLGRRVAVVVSGGNVELTTLMRIAEQYQDEEAG
jgi:threonine dehydratase